MQANTDLIAKAVVKFLMDKGHVTSPLEVFDILTELKAALASIPPQTGSAGSPAHPSTSIQARGNHASDDPAFAAPKPPAVDPKKSVFPDYLICLEDGERVVLLRRHIKTKYGMTPDQYRIKWGLPSDYPMVAPKFAERKSEFAKLTGFGRSHRAEFKEHYDRIKERLKRESRNNANPPSTQAPAATVEG